MNRIHNRWRRAWKKAGCVVLAGIMMCSSVDPVWATSVSKTQKEKEEAEQKRDSANQKAQEAENNKKAAETKVNQLSTELTDLLSVIQILENDMALKEEEIAQAQEDYEAAKAQEEKQYEAMKKRIKYMYEKGDTQYIEILLQVKSMSDLLNKAQYVEEIYKYDRKMLVKYQETKDEVKNFQLELEEDKGEMEVMEGEYIEQKKELETMIAKKRTEVNNFDAQLEQAKKDAAVYTKAVEEKTAQLRKAKEEEERRKQEEARKKAEEEARKKAAAAAAKNTAPAPKSAKNSPANNTYTGPSAAKSSGGTAEGRAVADYALQFIGNPYVYGGTSLTNGTDCSGFTQGVYKHFGINLPRTSTEQRSAGRGVDYSEAQPGDLICYAGHVALYIGNGQIVHASTPTSGIKVSNATYRTILAVRRIL